MQISTFTMQKIGEIMFRNRICLVLVVISLFSSLAFATADISFATAFKQAAYINAGSTPLVHQITQSMPNPMGPGYIANAKLGPKLPNMDELTCSFQSLPNDDGALAAKLFQGEQGESFSKIHWTLVTIGNGVKVGQKASVILNQKNKFYLAQASQPLSWRTEVRECLQQQYSYDVPGLYTTCTKYGAVLYYELNAAAYLSLAPGGQIHYSISCTMKTQNESKSEIKMADFQELAGTTLELH